MALLVREHREMKSELGAPHCWRPCRRGPCGIAQTIASALAREALDRAARDAAQSICTIGGMFTFHSLCYCVRNPVEDAPTVFNPLRDRLESSPWSDWPVSGPGS